MIEVGHNHYGKSAIRLVKVVRGETPHRVRDLTIDIALEGDFDTSYTEGDNSGVIATDTMKNTAYALAKDQLVGSIEEFGIALGRHFAQAPQVEMAYIKIKEHAWRQIESSPDSFRRDGSETRTADLSVSADAAYAGAGIEDLVLMKTTRSAFEGFPRDRFTTLAETDDRIMATRCSAEWSYMKDVAIDFDASYAAIRSTLLDVFAEHHSASVQASIWIIGKAIIERHPEVDHISMSLPNLHHWTVDLSPFGIANDREVYVSTTEPHGLIEATIRRSEG
jgi:urate oxidase